MQSMYQHDPHNPPNHSIGARESEDNGEHWQGQFSENGHAAVVGCCFAGYAGEALEWTHGSSSPRAE
jgi:hypothetical protein